MFSFFTQANSANQYILLCALSCQSTCIFPCRVNCGHSRCAFRSCLKLAYTTWVVHSLLSQDVKIWHIVFWFAFLKLNNKYSHLRLNTVYVKETLQRQGGWPRTYIQFLFWFVLYLRLEASTKYLIPLLYKIHTKKSIVIISKKIHIKDYITSRICFGIQNIISTVLLFWSFKFWCACYRRLNISLRRILYFTRVIATVGGAHVYQHHQWNNNMNWKVILLHIRSHEFKYHTYNTICMTYGKSGKTNWKCWNSIFCVVDLIELNTKCWNLFHNQF